MATIDKSALLAQKFGVEDVEVPGVGTVQVRPLSRAEAHELRGKEMAEVEMEIRLLSLALVEPKLTADDVKAWQAVAPAGQIDPVIKAIMRLSGMEKQAAKATFPENGSGA